MDLDNDAREYRQWCGQFADGDTIFFDSFPDTDVGYGITTVNVAGA